MLHESVLRTKELPAADRFEAWTERLGRTHAPMRLLSDRAHDYHGVQRLIPLGEVTIWPASFDHLVFQRTPRLVRQSDPEVYHLSLLLRGEGAADWGGRQAAYRVKDLHVSHSSRAFEVATGPDPVSIVGVEIPRSAVVLPGRCAQDRVLGRVDGKAGLGALLTQFLMQLADDTAPYHPSDAARLGTVVIDLVTALFAHLLDAERAMTPETRARALTLRIKEFVRRNLADPDLSPATIAAAHHVSRSYLYRLFQAEGLTVSAYLREQRLKNAHRDLTDPALHGLPIHAVAARWGFPRAAEFTRAFRSAYGDTPSEVRARAARGGLSRTGAP
ncbi:MULTISPECIES: helix-turn-helix domain-containing protein [unclassified Streptomyces]|uniref:helix-turn-helix domain-containing protein n=1 Tax=unclassified Streptomyces TaxID=2593676 RepID=UPI000DD57FFF|nr:MULTISPECIES: helix-turn-helix domain-containing protein [unclassified Streptomyces]QZZ32111.1 helix-turn-helix domain-containing protein [Streptomyces sp. ST1015]